MIIQTVLLVIIILTFLVRKKLVQKDKIPVYYGMPLVGFLFHFRNGNYCKKMIELKNTHGALCKVQMGSYQSVWLNDYRLIREAWSNPEFCGRPKLPGITMRTHGFRGGIIFNDGKQFTEQRRFTVKHLKDFGLGKTSMENLMHQEVQEVVKNITENINVPISTRHLFNIAALNILWAITAGERFNYADQKLSELTETLARNMELQGGTMLAFFMPWLAKWFPNFVGWTTYLKDSHEVFEFWKHYAHQRLNSSNCNTTDDNDNNDNFIKFYSKAIHECNDPDSSFYEDTGELSLAATLQDLFIAGTETSATTLEWIFLYAAVYQEYQKKLHKEIETVIGSCQATLADRRKMANTEAFIMEVMRFCTLAPLGMVHSTLNTTTLQGYEIPKGTLIYANLSAAHHDPAAWNNPGIFFPERFLSADCKSVIRPDAFLAFSYGKRGCPGEALARNELFLFVVGILQKFEIVLDPTQIKVDLSPKLGVSATPRPHKLVFKFNKVTKSPLRI